MQNEKFQFIKKNFQIIYSLALIIFIPVAIIGNTILFTNFFKKNIDQDLYNKAISISRVVNADILDSFQNAEGLQKKLENIAKFNDEITAMDVIVPGQDTFKVAASLDKKIIGQKVDAFESVMAWHQNQPVAFLTTSYSPNSISQEPNFKSNERFWVVVTPMVDSENNKQMLLSMKMSLAVMDELTRTSLVRSYVILALTVIIIILLLINNTRLFEYATLYRKLKEVDQMKDEFISIASHELRTPVTGIKGFVSMILEGNMGEVNDKVKSSLKLVQGATERLAVLVEDLLNVSRIEQGRMQIDVKPAQPNQIIKDIISELKVQADTKQLKLTYAPHSEIIPEINIDIDRFKQILINIIGNAIKYTPSGSIAVSTKMNDKNDKLQIKVKDTGIGMSAKARERLFEKFYRIQNEKTEKIIGTGLGLWITKQLIEMMGGEITVDSIENVGTEMTIEFPTVKK